MVKKTINNHKVTETEGEFWFRAFVDRNTNEDDGKGLAMCPVSGCKGHLLDGPWGGLAQNVKCNICEREWNLAAIIKRMDPI